MSTELKLLVSGIKEFLKDLNHGDYLDGILEGVAFAVSFARSLISLSGEEKKLFVIEGIELALTEAKKEGYLTFITGSVEHILVRIMLPHLVESAYQIGTKGLPEVKALASLSEEETTKAKKSRKKLPLPVESLENKELG